MNNKELVVSSLKIKKKLIKDKLEQINSHFLKNIENKLDILNNNIGETIEINEVNQLIKFYDEYSKTMEKLNSNILNKNKLYNVCKAVNESFFIENLKKEKENFNLICNYKKRNVNNIKDISSLYKEKDTGKYLIIKTFKKTCSEVYDIMNYFNVDKILNNKFSEKEIITINCWGGGPGSDLSGLILSISDFITKNNNKKIICNIYDINNKLWENLLDKKLKEILIKELKITNNFEINFLYLNFDENTENHIIGDIFTICWTLNETNNLNKNFWKNIIENNKNSMFLFIEGDDRYLNIIFELFNNNSVIYEKYRNPRYLIKL